MYLKNGELPVVNYKLCTYTGRLKVLSVLKNMGNSGLCVYYIVT